MVDVALKRAGNSSSPPKPLSLSRRLSPQSKTQIHRFWARHRPLTRICWNQNTTTIWSNRAYMMMYPLRWKSLPPKNVNGSRVRLRSVFVLICTHDGLLSELIRACYERIPSISVKNGPRFSWKSLSFLLSSMRAVRSALSKTWCIGVSTVMAANSALDVFYMSMPKSLFTG
jgi:hypothetical protein